MTDQLLPMTSKTWSKRWRIGRIQIGWRIHRHDYPDGDHRLVIHPVITIDYGQRRDTDDD